ncbi:hemopexin isoform X2 [Emydura macquarii macquarii]|uniref:hemopexin isoform X2 n=1 Tax=Emydura macquarii macquarii TaxID=1129001 RepID=UPI00352A9A30
MRGTVAALALSWALALGLTRPLSHGEPGQAGARVHHGAEPQLNDTEVLRRCADEGGFDAVTLDEQGLMLFFRGDHVWKGFHGPAQPINATWPEIQGPVDAALRMHREKQPDAHHSVYLFQGARVWAYAGGRLRPGYPRLIGEEFKGVPEELDGALECHPEDCQGESLLFFKGQDVFSYNLELGVVKRRSWPEVANCSAAVHWLGRYYCFRGARFLRFQPATGQVPPGYPRDARDYFMRCPGRGHGHETRRNASLVALRDPCSGLPFQAFSTDDAGRTYAFRGGQYFRVDAGLDGWHSWPLNHSWPELQGEVDSAFSWDKKIYLIQGSQVYIYRAGQGYALVQGYPRPLRDELGVEGADAAFTCPGSAELYVIRGSQMQRVDLRQSPRRPEPARPIPHARVDSATCGADGVRLLRGDTFHHYVSAAELSASSRPAPAHNVTAGLLGCPH